MTDQTALTLRPGLGVGGIVGESFTIFFRRFFLFVLLAFLPILALQVIVLLAFGGVLTTHMLTGVHPAGGGMFAGAFVIVGVAVVIGTALLMAIFGFMVQAAYDTKLGRPVRLGRYFGGALSQLLPLLICSVIAAVLIYFAMLFVILPGLWVMAVFSMVVPVIVIERAGLGALGRSAALTKGYRWPIVGALFLLSLCALVFTVITTAIGIAATAVSGGLHLGLIGTLLGTAWQSVELAVSYGIVFIGLALIYARLREIKEGASVENLADVFA